MQEAAMKTLTLTVTLVALFVAFFVVPVAFGADAKQTTFKGTILEIKDGKIEVKDKDGKKISYTTDEKTEITIDGKKAKVSELNSGMEVTVTPPKKGVATKIEAKKK
jgi:hypothetical protein